MRRLKYLTLCSGIEAQSVAWEDQWDAIAFSEIDLFCNAFLGHKYPAVPNLGDMTAIDWTQITDADILMGSTPCQSFSLAGSRKSLDDSRGQLTQTLIEAWNELTDRNQCPILFWENVDGILSTKDNAFGCLLAAILGQRSPITPRGRNGKWSRSGFFLGQHRSIAYRVLNAQYFGVPQRRNRIFLCAIDTRVLGKLFPEAPKSDLSGLGGIPAAILFEPEGERRIAQASSQAKRKVAKTSKSGTGEPPNFCREEFLAAAIADHLGLEPPVEDWELGSGDTVVGPILANCGTKQWLGNQEGFSGRYHLVKSIAFSSVDNGRDAGEVCPPIRAGKHDKTWANGRGGGAAIAFQEAQNNYVIRRFTPSECLKLMGFPETYLDFEYQGKPASDTRKYGAIGNSIAVPCLEWLQQRTTKVLDAIAEQWSKVLLENK